MEISHSLGKMNSLFCFIKGPKSLNEIKESYWIINKLNIEPKIKKILIDNKENNLIIYKKEFKTPNFLPRRWKDIKTFYS
jgi:16S rRNA (guanine527-N7)-methyltransferase